VDIAMVILAVGRCVIFYTMTGGWKRDLGPMDSGVRCWIGVFLSLGYLLSCLLARPSGFFALAE